MRLKLSGFTCRIMLVAATVLFAAAACGGNDGGKEAAVTSTPPATESVAPAFPSDTPAAPYDDTVPSEIETAARKLLADELNVDEGDFRLDGSESVQWSDASLGCPKEGMMYAQVITPGYRLVIHSAGTSHAVHTNSDGSNVVVCGEGR